MTILRMEIENMQSGERRTIEKKTDKTFDLTKMMNAMGMLRFAHGFVKEANKYKDQGWKITKFETDDAYLYVKLKEDAPQLNVVLI